MAGLRIAMSTHSTHPRGGVVHALELAEALQALGQEVTLMAVDEAGSPAQVRQTAKRLGSRFPWTATAQAHLAIYRRFLSPPFRNLAIHA